MNRRSFLKLLSVILFIGLTNKINLEIQNNEITEYIKMLEDFMRKYPNRHEEPKIAILHNGDFISMTTEEYEKFGSDIVKIKLQSKL